MERADRYWLAAILDDRQRDPERASRGPASMQFSQFFPRVKQ
jgi:hypothetical protein